MPLTGDRKREYQRTWIQQRREAYLHGKACAKCGSTDALEIDHIDPKTKDPRLKSGSGSKIFTWSAERQAAELVKCQILCGGCHKVKSAEDAKNRAGHGRRQMYVKYKCRCSKCLTWRKEETARDAEWRRRRII